MNSELLQHFESITELNTTRDMFNWSKSIQRLYMTIFEAV